MGNGIKILLAALTGFGVVWSTYYFGGGDFMLGYNLGLTWFTSLMFAGLGGAAMNTVL
jgi:hypothetical protein